jgi:hypothetical protein
LSFLKRPSKLKLLQSLVFRFAKIYEQKTPQSASGGLKGILLWATAR